MVLYLRPSDFGDVKEVNFDASQTLEIFTAYETASGVELYSKNNHGTVYRESFNSVLEKYDYKHGDIKRDSGDSEKFKEIIDGTEAYTFTENGYDVRYLCADDKYAIGVMSEKGSFQELLCFVYEYFDGYWIVSLSDLESETNLKSFINSKIPDFNLDMLPEFDVRDAAAKLMPEEDLVPFAEALVEEEVIKPDDNYEYISGTNNCVYVVFESGRKIVFINQSGQWTFYEVDGWILAEVYIMNYAAQMHSFVLKQE